MSILYTKYLRFRKIYGIMCASSIEHYLNRNASDCAGKTNYVNIRLDHKDRDETQLQDKYNYAQNV